VNRILAFHLLDLVSASACACRAATTAGTCSKRGQALGGEAAATRALLFEVFEGGLTITPRRRSGWETLLVISGSLLGAFGITTISSETTRETNAALA